MSWNAEEIEALMRELAEGHELGGLNPEALRVKELLAGDPPGPLQFLNLLAYHPTARYPAGHPMAEKGLTGAEAYALYGQVAIRHVTKRGGRLALYNDVVQGLIGDDGGWDQVAIMEYPSVAAFVDMVRDSDYRASLVHRDAGLERTAVVVTRSLLPA